MDRVQGGSRVVAVAVLVHLSGVGAARAQETPPGPDVAHVAAEPLVASVVVVARGNTTQEDSRRVASELAAALTEELAVTASGGRSVQKQLTKRMRSPVCLRRPRCLAAAAGRLRSDRVLFVSMKRVRRRLVVSMTVYNSVAAAAAEGPTVTLGPNSNWKRVFRAAAPRVLPGASGRRRGASGGAEDGRAPVAETTKPDHSKPDEKEPDKKKPDESKPPVHEGTTGPVASDESAGAGQSVPGGNDDFTTGGDDAFEDLDGDLAVGGEGKILRSFKGFLSSRFRSYPADRGQGQNDDTAYLEGQLELDVALFERVHFFLRPWLLVDVLDTDLVRYEPLEAYVQVDFSSADVRLGQFVESWGLADAFSPLDVLNRKDLALDLLDPISVGEAGVRVRVFGDGGQTFGEPTLSFYAMPVWRSTDFPTDANRFSFGQDGFVFRDDLEEGPSIRDDVSSGLVHGTLAAIRFEHTVSTDLFAGDFQYIVARGPDRFPYLQPSPRADGLFDLIPHYFGNWVGGAGFRIVPNARWWSALTLKAEVVYKRPYAINDLPMDLPEDYTQFAVGFDRQFSRVFRGKDQLVLKVEYLGEFGADGDTLAQFRPYDADAAVRLGWRAGDFASSEVELRGIVDVHTAETVAEATLSRNLRFIYRNLALRITGRYVRAERDEPTLYGFFPTNNSSVAGELRLRF